MAVEAVTDRRLDGLTPALGSPLARSPRTGVASTREDSSSSVGGSGGGEKKEFLRYFWTDDRHLTDKWWAEVIHFIGFKKGKHWLAEKILAPKFPSLKEWFDSFRGHSTGTCPPFTKYFYYLLMGLFTYNLFYFIFVDPQDLGQLRFSHLLRAKACEGVLKQMRQAEAGGVSRS